MNRSIASRLGSLIFLILAAIVAYWLVVNRQLVLDDVALWNYQPSAQVVAIADKTTMTDQARHVFYASHPDIADAATFNQACGKSEQGAAVLGCYTGMRIYVYDITDPQLAGIQEVTAAHEMLHAIYQRMPASDKQAVNVLLEQEYVRLSKDPAFADRMALYARTEPGERDNELHSIVGTEVGSIDPGLEAHYAKYFKSRAAVIAFHDQYSSVFTKLKAESDSLSAQMAQLQSDIRSRSSAYDTASKQLSSDIASFNQRAEDGSFSSGGEFNSERQALIARVNRLAAERNAINAMIDRYDTLVKQYNSIATQTDQLNQSMNSSLAPAPSL